jgi:hypothetical protein
MGPGEITRIIATNDAAYFFHSKGEVWIMTGEPPVDGLGGSLRIDKWRSELTLLAPRSARVMDGRLYALTDRGVVEITQGGYSVPSDAIAPTLKEALDASDDTFATAWAFVHPIERRYCLGVNTGETWKFFVYQADSGSWVTMDRAFQCAVWNHLDERLYLVDEDTSYTENISTDSAPYADDGDEFDIQVTLPPFVAGDGSTPCQLREVQVVAENAAPVYINVRVATEIASTANPVYDSSSNVFRATVPREAQRAMRHTVSLSTESNALWDIGSVVLLFQTYQERGTK